MNAPAANKPAEKSSPKPNTAKLGVDQEKAINQFRQEIRTLSKTVKEMQQRPGVQMVNVGIPRELFLRVNAYLLDYAKETGKAISLNELICDALNMY